MEENTKGISRLQGLSIKRETNYTLLAELSFDSPLRVKKEMGERTDKLPEQNSLACILI